jgi:GNAT superfamily N-acetyltransferase
MAVPTPVSHASPVEGAGHPYPDEWACDALLMDGTPVSMRPIRPEDNEALNDFHEHLSLDTVYKRFFNAHLHLRPVELERFTQVDYVDRLALVAERAGRLLGVARYDRLADSPSAEVAFVVADGMQGRGLGTLLLEHLAAAARSRGISTFVADTLATNDQMQGVFRQAGFASRSRLVDGVVRVTFPIASSQGYLDALLDRHSHSARAWLDPAPRPDAELWAVCPSRRSAGALEAAAASAGVAISPLVVPGDPSLGLAALSGLGGRKVIVVLDGAVLPRRLVTVARAAVTIGSVVALDPTSAWSDACRQAGLHTCPTAGSAIAALQRPGPATAPEHTGRLVELSGCDPARARRVLDEVADIQGQDADLDPDRVAEVLDSYAVAHRPPARLIAGDEGAGLAVTSCDPSGRRATRFVPLTDRDAEQVAGPQADTALRLSRLVEEQSDIHRIAVSPDEYPSIRTGGRRGNADDPLVRRLPCPAARMEESWT